MRKQKITIMRGCSGGGKSTQAQTIARRTNAAIISSDGIRSAYFVDYGYDPYSENFVAHICLKSLEYFLAKGRDVVIDNTNLAPHHVKPFIDLIQKYIDMGRSIDINFIDLSEVPLKELKKNNSKRERKVDESIIEKQYNSLSRHKNFYSDIYSGYDKITLQDHLPKCVIFDLDGTLAISTDRSYKDKTGFLNDEVNQYVLDLYNGLSEDYHRIICTARPLECEVETIEWLEFYDIGYSNIYFRGQGDTRSDHLVKEDMWREIAKDYNISFLVDDRVSVTEHARNLGLNVFSVNSLFY